MTWVHVQCIHITHRVTCVLVTSYKAPLPRAACILHNAHDGGVRLPMMVTYYWQDTTTVWQTPQTRRKQHEMCAQKVQQNTCVLLSMHILIAHNIGVRRHINLHHFNWQYGAIKRHFDHATSLCTTLSQRNGSIDAGGLKAPHWHRYIPLRWLNSNGVDNRCWRCKVPRAPVCTAVAVPPIFFPPFGAVTTRSPLVFYLFQFYGNRAVLYLILENYKNSSAAFQKKQWPIKFWCQKNRAFLKIWNWIWIEQTNHPKVLFTHVCTNLS